MPFDSSVDERASGDDDQTSNQTVEPWNNDMPAPAAAENTTNYVLPLNEPVVMENNGDMVADNLNYRYCSFMNIHGVAAMNSCTSVLNKKGDEGVVVKKDITPNEELEKILHNKDHIERNKQLVEAGNVMSASSAATSVDIAREVITMHQNSGTRHGCKRCL